MNIAFYIDEMNFRGVANSTYQYSHFNELILISTEDLLVKECLHTLYAISSLESYPTKMLIFFILIKFNSQ